MDGDIKQSSTQTQGHVQSQTQTPRSKAQKKHASLVALICTSIAVVALSASNVYFYKQYSNLKKDPAITSRNELDDLTKKVSKLLSVPTDEQPTLATIEDISKLKDQTFFKESKNGDKLLVYAKAQKAIIYRDSENKLVNVGPVSLSASADTQAQEKQPMTDVKQ
jgi:hypothetical protein